MEARCYGFAKRYHPFLVNTVVGFIGPEYLYDSNQVTRAGLEDHFMGKLSGIPMGCDCCYTNHMMADQNDIENLALLLGAAGVNYILGVPSSDDIMLNYQTNAYHDINAVREILHLRPIPGTDGALALGMANVIINEHLEAAEYIEKYTHGYEAYKEYVMEFSPKKASEITGVPEEDIIRAARMYAGEGPASLMMSASPVVHNVNGFQNARAITLLMALTGNFGVPGGNFAPGPARTPLYRGFMMEKVWRSNPRGDLSFEEFPLWNTLVPEVQVSRIADYLQGLGAYPQRNLIAFGMNHHMWPRPDRVEEALKGLEFFVNADIYMNDTCKYADIVLPITPQPERESIELIGPMVYYQPEVVKPQGEAKNDMEVLIELGKRLGFYMDKPEIHNYEEYLEARIKTTGLTLEELRQHPEGMKAKMPLKMRRTEDIVKVQTPTGKIEFESTLIAEMFREDHEPLPIYHDFREKLPLDEYPLILSTGSRKPHLFHSRCYRIPWLNQLEDSPLLEIHPQDAKALQIEEGEVVTLKTPKGSMDFTAVYHAGCLKGTVNVYHGAGEKDINYIMDDLYLDPISGFPGFKSYCCRIEKKEA